MQKKQCFCQSTTNCVHFLVPGGWWSMSQFVILSFHTHSRTGISSNAMMDYRSLDDLLKLIPVCEEVPEEQQKITAKRLKEGTLDPADIAFKLLYQYELKETADDKEEDSGLNKMASVPPHCSPPQPSSSRSSGYHSGSSEGSLSPPGQCRNDGKYEKNCRKRKHEDNTKFPSTLDAISEESAEDELGDDKNCDHEIELTEEEKNNLDVNFWTNQYLSQYIGKMDAGSSKEKQQQEYLESLQEAVRKVDKQIDSIIGDDADEITFICEVKKKKA